MEQTKMTEAEIWVIYPQNNNYEVSDMGRVYSKRRRIILKPIRHNCGYTYVKFPNRKEYSIHRLVLETFVGKCPSGMECSHNNGVRIDNRLENIEWLTHSANCLLRNNKGELNANVKLTNVNIVSIRKMYNDGQLQQDIAVKFGIARSHVSKIVNKKNWKHI